MKQVFTIPRKCLTQEREQNLLNKGFEKEEHFLTIPLKYLLMRGKYEKTVETNNCNCSYFEDELIGYKVKLETCSNCREISATLH